MRQIKRRPIALLRITVLAGIILVGGGNAHAAEFTAAVETAAVADQGIVADADLVVTGRRDDRNAEIQETPLSITTLSGAKLSQQGITNVRELGNVIPNLFQSRTAVSYLNTTFFIRGVGEAQGEPSVPVYVDGIYIPKTLGSQSELLDIERIDVFRGPQGQAFGHAAAGGAVVMTTTLPSETPVFRAQASICFARNGTSTAAPTPPPPRPPRWSRRSATARCSPISSRIPTMPRSMERASS